MMQPLDVKVQTFEVLIPWRIDHFTLRCEIDKECISTKKFRVQSKEQCEWCIMLYPFGISASSEDNISLCLGYAAKKRKNLHTHVKFDLRDKYGKCLLDTDYKPVDLDIGQRGTYFDECLCFERDKILPLEDDVLIINCFLKWDANNLSVYKFNNQNKLSENFIELMGKNTFSDVVLVANDGTEFSAHKGILAIRSPVFEIMFSHDMKEKNESRVEIDDLDASTLRAVLRYIYASEFDKDKDKIVKVFAAADKYSLENLKQICELEIMADLKIENAVDCLLLADKHSSESLKNGAFKFISTHLNEVLETDSFKSLKVVNPSLLEEILGIVSKQMKKK